MQSRCRGRGQVQEMRPVKIVLQIVVGLLVTLALIVERPVVASLLGSLNLEYYYKAALVVAMIVAFVLAWGYKHKIEASQHYQQAQNILAAAKAAAKRRERACMLLEEKMKADVGEKERALLEQIETLRREHRAETARLQNENLQLKQTLAGLMQNVADPAPPPDDIRGRGQGGLPDAGGG